MVDSGSTDEYKDKCKEICNNYGIRYIYHDSVGKAFSIGACRDYGVRFANGNAITFLDVDLRMPKEFWDRLLMLMDGWKISHYKKSFLAIPCLYLTEEGTREFLAVEDDAKYSEFYLRYLQQDKNSVEGLALCSSVMVVDKLHYLSIGGHDPEFQGHGYEDFELYHRLLGEEKVIPKPPEYYIDKKTWETYTYSGFRSYLSMVGRPALMMNLFVTHLWHPRPKTASFYSTDKIIHNRKIWVDKFQTFDKTGTHPDALISYKAEHKNILYFGVPKTNSDNCLRDIYPLLGKPVYVSEYDFVDDNGLLTEDFQAVLDHYAIERIVFPNPYGNPARLRIYEWCKQVGFPFVCFERGALPDSWFFDEAGCNADSKSYDLNNWGDIELNKEQIVNIKDYIAHTISGENVLEKQDYRIGSEALAQKLRLGSKKVLFVPLQRPGDTVIKHMIGKVGSYNNFITIIDKLAKRLKAQGWVVLCKKHPLEADSPAMPNVQFVSEDTNFLDLIELSDGVALINSGVGVYSMMMEKPCYIFGDAFYSCEGLNENIGLLTDSDLDDEKSLDSLVLKITQGKKVNTELMYKFLFYLKESFYSFGKAKTTLRNNKDGTFMTITTGIDFYDIKLFGKEKAKYSAVPRPQLNTTAPIFERYGLDIHVNKGSKGTKTKVEDKNKVKVSVAPVVISDSKNKQTHKSIPKAFKKSPEYIRKAKWEKFRRHPHKFCADSKFSIVRLCKYFFKKEVIHV